MTRMRLRVPTHPRQRAIADHGFTMIELLIALVLTGIVIMVISRPLLDGLRTGNHAIVTQAARSDVRATLTQLRQDADATRAPQRTSTNVRSANSMARALTRPQNGVTTENPKATGNIDVYDVLTATATTLVMRADIDGSVNGVECVRYDIVTAPKYSVTRTVFPDPVNCGGGPILGTPTQLIKPHAISRQTNQVPTFQYRLQCNSTASPLWVGAGGRCAASRNCNVMTVPSVAGADRNAIIGIAFDVTAVAQRADTVAESSASVEAPLPTRATTNYRRALGCE